MGCNRIHVIGSQLQIGILQGGIRSLYNDLGAHTHNSIGGSQTLPEASQLEVFEM